MSDYKRPSFRAFIRRLNPGKGTDPSSDSKGTAAVTPAVSQGGLSAGLPLMSVSSVSVAVTKDPRQETISLGSSASKAENASTISTTNYEYNDQQQMIQQLWKEAINNVQASKDGEKLSEVIRAQEQSSAEDAQITLSDLIKRLETEMKRFGTQKRLAEAMEKIVPHLNRFAVVGDIAVSMNPNPAALPWAANLTAREEIRGKIVEGIAEITVLVFECSVYHELYLSSSASTYLPINANLRRTITDALSHCIRFLGFALRRQQAAAKAFTDAFRLEDFTGYLKGLNISKDKLHDAGSLCELHHNSQSRDQLRALHDLMVDMRLESSERAEERVKSQLRNLLVDPKDVFDHIYHPHDSFCLEGTRVQVLHDIEKWAHDPSSPTICWLPGLAGTGKSTISRTISRNLKTKSLGASFFFKRGAGKRGNGRHLFSILAYQLALYLPPILPYILEAMKEDHSLNVAPIQIQWQKLILSPLSKLQDEGLAKPIVFVLDALDECDEQDRGEIFRLLLATCPAILRVFLTSRPELDIMGHFANEPLHKEIVLHKLHVGTIESDFRVYLRQAMQSFVVEYNRTHPQKHMQLSSDWPGEERFELLLHKALPLFIAAATFVRMISDRHWAKSPDSKIDFIIDKSSRVNSTYEALYKPVLTLILSGAPDEDKDEVRKGFLDIIGSLVLLASPLPIVSLARLLGVDAWSISSQVDPLRSVIDVPEDDSPLQLFHLSFRDYILSQSAGDLQVSELKTQDRLASRCLGLMRGTLKVNICGLSSPGEALLDIEPSTIDDHLPAEIQYACLYWVHHLESAGVRIHDEGDAHCFLQGWFSNWLEVLCLLGRLDDALRMLQELQVRQETSGASVLQFIQDAIQFIRYFRTGIEETPLQIYHSGTIFSPKGSIAPTPFKDRHYPDYIVQPSIVDPNWPQSQTLEVVDEGLSQLAFLPDNKLASIDYEGDIRVWDQRSCSRLHSISHGSKRGFITVLAWYNSRIIAVGWPDMITIYDLDNGASIWSLPLTGVYGVESIAFSDDGRFICSVDLESVVFIYSLDTGKCVSKFDIPDKHRPILLSPKGQWIAAIAQNSMLLSRWSCSTKPSWTFLGPQHEHDIVRFSSDGCLVASLSSTSKMVKVWSTESYEYLHTLHFETPIVHDQLALNKDWLIVSLRSHRTLVLDMKTGVLSKTVCSFIRAGPAISDDGTLLAGQSLEGAVRIWDLTSMASTEDSTATRRSMGVEMVTPFRDENTILSHSRGGIKIWDMASGVCKEALEPEIPLETQTFVAAATEAPVFAILKDKTVEIWNTNPPRQASTFERTFNHLGALYCCLAISANGGRLAVGSSEPGTVEIWDVENTVLQHTLAVPLNGFPRVAFSPDASKIAYTIWGAIKIRCLPGLETLTIKTEVESGESFIDTLTFRGERLIGAYLNTQVQVWNTCTGESLFLSQPHPELQHFGTGTSFLNLDAIVQGNRADDDILGTYYIGDDPAWVIRNGERILWLPPDYKPESAYMSGTTMVLGTYSGRVLFLYLKE
ncbi:heterokaryon incompatibility protein het-E-1 [Fusarium tjaetaba]|uniref:Heterokaryon incompatibility protein het-E-1 n=1 Tax=Fusarium tjaetaba TaxID=1567544 RepID=A0A8H5RSD2_9HYPO|nr:heterokaryon incompatibility protein het-E-1 [Fusarium tjaetaba]KAF5638757.1 heterokaryon incompatibility protein het-E-1 [Fusarium tjaetaba]